jgi:hypothetical protein
MEVVSSLLPSVSSSSKQPATKATRRSSSKATIQQQTSHVTRTSQQSQQPTIVDVSTSSSSLGSHSTTQTNVTSSTLNDTLAVSDFGGAYGYDDAGGIGSLSTGTLDADRDVAHLTGNASAVIPGSDITEGQFLRLSPDEQRKQRRLIRNRLSAHMHRQRQRGHIDAMETQVTELSLVILEMRERLLAARNALSRVVAELPSSSTTAIEAAITADSLIFVPGVMKYQPPKEPGLLGFTGPTKDALGAIRNAVSTGLVGIGVKPMCAALNGGGGGGVSGMLTSNVSRSTLPPSIPSMILKPVEIGSIYHTPSVLTQSLTRNSQPLLVANASLPVSESHPHESHTFGHSTQQNGLKRNNGFSSLQSKIESSLASNHSSSSSLTEDELVSDEGVISNGSSSPHSDSNPTQTSSPDTLEIGSNGKRTKIEMQDKQSGKKSKTFGSAGGRSKKARLSQSATGGGGSSLNTTATSSSSSGDERMNPSVFTRSTSALSTTSGADPIPPTSTVPEIVKPISISTLSSSLIDFLPHKPAPIPLLLERDDINEDIDNDDDDDNEGTKRADEIVNAVFNGVKAPSETKTIKPLPKLSFSRMPSFEVTSSSPLGGEDGIDRVKDVNFDRGNIGRGIPSPSPFFSMTRSGPFMRMDSFDPPRNIPTHTLYLSQSNTAGVAIVSGGRPSATSDASGISIDKQVEATMSEIDQKLDSNASNGFSRLSNDVLIGGKVGEEGLVSIRPLNLSSSLKNNDSPPTSTGSSSAQTAVVTGSVAGTHNPKALRVLTSSESSSVPQIRSVVGGNGGLVFTSSSPLALGAIALFGLIAFISQSTQTSEFQSVPPGIHISSSSFASTIPSFKLLKQSTNKHKPSETSIGRLLLSNEMRNVLGVDSSHSSSAFGKLPLHPLFHSEVVDDSLLSKRAMLVLASASADFEKDFFATSSSSTALQSYSWPYSMLWSREENKDLVSNSNERRETSSATSSVSSVTVQRSELVNNEKINTNNTSEDLITPHSKGSLRASSTTSSTSNNNKVAVSFQSRSTSLVDLSSIAAAGRALGRSMAQMVSSNSIVRDSERESEKVDIPHIGRTSSYLSTSDHSSSTDDDIDISNERVIERELKAALQTYADAARMAYIRTQKRLSAESLSSTRLTDQSDKSKEDEDDSIDGESQRKKSSTGGASVVLCPDAFGSMNGLSIINRQRSQGHHSGIFFDKDSLNENMPPIVGSNILPLPPPTTFEDDDRSTTSSSTSSARVTSTSSPPYLLLLVPSNSMAGRGLVETLPESSSSSPHSSTTLNQIKVELQGSNANISSISSASSTTSGIPQDPSSSSQTASSTSQTISSGWVEVGCEVVSLRRVSGVPVSS